MGDTDLFFINVYKNYVRGSDRPHYVRGSDRPQSKRLHSPEYSYRDNAYILHLSWLVSIVLWCHQLSTFDPHLTKLWNLTLLLASKDRNQFDDNPLGDSPTNANSAYADCHSTCKRGARDDHTAAEIPIYTENALSASTPKSRWLHVSSVVRRVIGSKPIWVCSCVPMVWREMDTATTCTNPSQHSHKGVITKSAQRH